VFVVRLENFPQTRIQTASACQPRISGRQALPDEYGVAESFQAANTNRLSSPVAAGDGPFSLTKRVTKRGKSLAKQRIALAGARLAEPKSTELK